MNILLLFHVVSYCSVCNCMEYLYLHLMLNIKFRDCIQIFIES